MQATTKGFVDMFENDTGNADRQYCVQRAAASTAIRASIEPPSGLAGLVRHGGDAVWRAVFFVRRCIWFVSHLVSVALIVSSADEDAIGV